ncbi:hypothetical protein PVAR5_3618 [Paecilomyces variotii No. 5]|uniref:Uncharacterized protein n=1 Tax=Byssochlamys spectabilis (strain No. 5 / NBRC 109023) TaxID=1356009 RepID=V5FCY9_BYSSN|nr:hypothetical protein PVAR5_3618 [Paecilomyces variotii No. 5]
MKFIAILASTAALMGFTAANKVDLYHDNNCQDFFQTVDINPLSCASPPEGFSSMIIRETGQIGTVRVYSSNSCAGSLGTQYDTHEWLNRCAGFGTCNSLSLEA